MNLGVSGDMDKNIKINDFSLNLGHRDYNEKAGPGAYDLPPLLGNQTIIDSIHNPPAYSIGTQDKKKLLALSKDQANSLKGLESPGVWKYNIDAIKLKFNYPKATIGRERRFHNHKSRDLLNMSLPHWYDSIDRDGIKEYGNRTNSFTKCKRFLERERKEDEEKDTPSSQSYNPELSIKSKLFIKILFSYQSRSYWKIQVFL